VLTAAGRTQATAAMSEAFMTNLTAMSLLALLVGLFLIFNSVSFSVLQRRPLIAVLRALGMTRRQLLAMILLEAGLLGLAAAALGIVAGTWLGGQLLELVSRSINDLYFRVSVTEVTVSGFSMSKGLAAGIGAALAAAAAPAIEATTYEPRLAMVRSSLERRTGRILPAVTFAGLATMAVAVLLLLLSGRDLVAGLAAVFLLILGFSFCVPLVVRTVAGSLAPMAQRIGGTSARMAVSGIAASLSRTGVAIVALAVAVSATIGVSVMVDSFRGSVADWLDRSLQADVYAGVRRGTLRQDVIEAIAGVDGVVELSTSRRVWLEDARGRTQLIVIRMAPGGYAGTELLDAEPAAVWPAWDSGDVIALPTDNGERRFEVAARFQSYDINSSAVMMSRATYDRHFDDAGVDTLGLYLADGMDVDEVIGEIALIGVNRQQLRVDSNAKIRQLSLQIFDRTFVITDVLYWLAIGVAFIGILGAMLALQLERAREFAMLRALGMTPGQVGGMISAKSGVIGLLSGAAAIPLGVAMAWVLIKVINRRAFGWQIDMEVAPSILWTAVLFAVGASLLAGLYPAWRASRSRPAVVMREE
jgi:putative ABC transport system permease protein